MSVYSCNDKGYAETLKDLRIIFKCNCITFVSARMKKSNILFADAKVGENLYMLKIMPLNENVYSISEILSVCPNVNYILKWHQMLDYRNTDSLKSIRKYDLVKGFPGNNFSYNCEYSKYIKVVLPENNFS